MKYGKGHPRSIRKTPITMATPTETATVKRIPSAYPVMDSWVLGMSPTSEAARKLRDGADVAKLADCDVIIEAIIDLVSGGAE